MPGGPLGFMRLIRVGVLHVQHDRHLVHPFQVGGFFLPESATDHSHIVSVQRELVIPTSASPAPLASFPSPDANEGIGLQVFNAPDCSTSRLPLVDQVWKRELKAF